MNDNIGSTIKSLAKFQFGVGVVVSVLVGFFLCFEIGMILGFLCILAGAILAWVLFLPLYGLGDVLEQLREIRFDIESLKSSIAHTDSSARHEQKDNKTEEHQEQPPQQEAFIKKVQDDTLIKCPNCGCQQKKTREVCWKCNSPLS